MEREERRRKGMKRKDMGRGRENGRERERTVGEGKE